MFPLKNSACKGLIIDQQWFSTGSDNQSGTKPNLVAKILATEFGVFLRKLTSKAGTN